MVINMWFSVIVLGLLALLGMKVVALVLSILKLLSSIKESSCFGRNFFVDCVQTSPIAILAIISNHFVSTKPTCVT